MTQPISFKLLIISIPSATKIVDKIAGAVSLDAVTGTSLFRMAV